MSTTTSRSTHAADEGRGRRSPCRGGAKNPAVSRNPFRGSDWSRRPWVIGTALDVWEIVSASRSYGTPDEMITATDLTEPHIRLALAYAEFSEEVDAAIAENERPLAELQRQYPTIDTIDAGE